MSSLASSFIRPRRNFAKVKSVTSMPNLIDIQKKSYAEFLQGRVGERTDAGLQGVFNSVFPVQDFDATASVEFVSYSLEESKYTEEECRSKGLTYSAPVKVMVRLLIWDVDHETGARSIHGFKEQEVYFGEIPLMTNNGTFIINGTERVVVSQLHRSPGVTFDHDKGKTHSSGKLLYSAKIIPYRGSWLDFEFDSKDIIYCRIDRRRKLPVTVLLKALGLTNEELLDYFYEKETISVREGKYFRTVDLEKLRGQRAALEIIHPETGKVLVKKNRRIGLGAIRQLQKAGVTELQMERDEVLQKVVGTDVVDEETGEVLFPVNTDITEPVLESLLEKGIHTFEVLFIDGVNADVSFRQTMIADKTANTEEALIEIYRRMRPGDPPTIENASSLFEGLFFLKERYDLSKVGRLKMNEKLDLEYDLDQRTLTRDDILRTVKRLLDVKAEKVKVDDIDHLGNRRVRAVGELLENQYRLGLTRIERAIKERLQLQDLASLMPHDLVNSRPVTAVVKEFFGSSQLSQFMEQTNPLAEVYHKRRLSALGPGGLSRERAGFEVRDVHNTHYGRICPIETPEGPNIGLIVSLATYARINQFGFIETPYREVVDRKPNDNVKYYSSSDEWRGQSIIPARLVNDEGKVPEGLHGARKDGESVTIESDEVNLMDVATHQPVSVAASLIPFLQNDDAHRALMGANMQRQGLPLLKTRSPLMGTGLERIVASDSGVTVIARRAGVVLKVDAERIVIKADSTGEEENFTEVASEVDIYNLVKFQRSNTDTCINQKPIVKVGERVQVHDIIADGFSTETGELALGQNMVVAFMPWNGYNFEDAIVVSEKVVRNDQYTSIHIEEFECVARDTKLGKEEITNDIPNVGEEALRNLDDAGIVRVGAEVKPGDILVGKLTPKAETQLTPEEKLLRAIFGEKAADVRDTSLRVSPGVSRGIVIGAKVFSREGSDVDERSIEIQEQETAKIKKDESDRIEIVRQSALEKLQKVLAGEVAAAPVEVKHHGEVMTVAKGQELPEVIFSSMSIDSIMKLEVVSPEKTETLNEIKASLQQKVNLIKAMSEDSMNRVRRGDELPPGVIKMVKVYVAIKRRLQVGDKLAGRHGNKGVISTIVPEEDMPFMADGESVDVVLSPLGVPSRMNIGQVLETHFGWAAYGLGRRLNEMMDKAFPRKEIEEYITKIWDDPSVNEFVQSCSDDELRDFVRKYKEGITIANPVFDGAREPEIEEFIQLAGLEGTQTTLYDGRTGDKFDRKVTVGVMYILKLHHLVDTKIHARSIGPYSLVTQQPLGGKAQFGGQRLGEMEVWAMEAYGAAYALQEFLTVKSDDIIGRTKMYEAIVKGENMMLPGLPESFNVLVKEMQSLGLDFRMIRDEEELSLEDLQREVTDSDDT